MRNRKRKNWLNSVQIFFLSAAVVCGCARQDVGHRKKYHDAQLAIGTYVQMDICAAVSEEQTVDRAMDEVWQRMRTIEQRMNAYNPDSEIGRVNRSGGQPVEVSEDVFAVVQRAVGFSKTTGGAFDITVRPLMDFWRRMQEEGRMPAPEDVKVIKDRVGSDQIHLSRNAGRPEIACPDGCALDLGAIAKGYVVDEAARILHDNGLSHFLIDAGGDMYAAGQSCGGDAWHIGVRHPRNAQQMADTIVLSDQAVATSGDYEQFYDIAGQRRSHILNPLTGYPQSGAVSATVIAPTAIEADAFATALTVLDVSLGMDLIDQMGAGYAAMVMVNTETGLKVHSSNGYRAIEASRIRREE